MKNDMRGSVAIVTGAGRGLGRALAVELASRGAQVVLAGRRPEPLVALADEVAALGGAALAVPADLTEAEDRSELVSQTLRAFGGIDILVNNAGIGRVTRFTDEDPSRVVETNLLAPIALTREVVPHMIDRRRGHVLTVASLAVAGLPFAVDYSASKAGLVAFSTAIREELRETGVSATVVSPGFMVDDGMYVPYDIPVPWYLGSNTTTVVARKAVRAMLRDRSSVITNRMPVRPLLVVQTISDKAFRWLTRSLGLRTYMSSLAEREIGYDGQSLSIASDTA